MRIYLFLLALIPLLSSPQNKDEIMCFRSEGGTYLEMDTVSKKGRFCNLNTKDDYLEVVCNIKISGDTLKLYGKTDYHYYQEHCEHCRVQMYHHQRSYTPYTLGAYRMLDKGKVLKEIPNVEGQLNLLEYTLNIPIAFLFPKEMERVSEIKYEEIPQYARKSARKRKLK